MSYEPKVSSRHRDTVHSRSACCAWVHDALNTLCTGDLIPASWILRADMKCEGGVEAMVAEQSAARKPANAVVAAARTSAAAATSLARPVVVLGKFNTSDVLPIRQATMLMLRPILLDLKEVCRKNLHCSWMLSLFSIDIAVHAGCRPAGAPTRSRLYSSSNACPGAKGLLQRTAIWTTSQHLAAEQQGQPGSPHCEAGVGAKELPGQEATCSWKAQCGHLPARPVRYILSNSI